MFLLRNASGKEEVSGVEEESRRAGTRDSETKGEGTGRFTGGPKQQKKCLPSRISSEGCTDRVEATSGRGDALMVESRLTEKGAKGAGPTDPGHQNSVECGQQHRERDDQRAFETWREAIENRSMGIGVGVVWGVNDGGEGSTK